MKPKFLAALASFVAVSATPASAADFDVEITNLTNGIWFTPFLVAAHPDGSNLFVPGQPASANLQAMAEGGDIFRLVGRCPGAWRHGRRKPGRGTVASRHDYHCNVEYRRDEQHAIVDRCNAFADE